MKNNLKTSKYVGETTTHIEKREKREVKFVSRV